MKTNSVAYVYSRLQSELFGWGELVGEGQKLLLEQCRGKECQRSRFEQYRHAKFRTQGRKARKKHVQLLKLHNIIGVWNEAVL